MGLWTFSFLQWDCGHLVFLQWDCGHLDSFHFKKTLLMSFFLERYFQNLDLFCSIEKAESILDLI